MVRVTPTHPTNSVARAWCGACLYSPCIGRLLSGHSVCLSIDNLPILQCITHNRVRSGLNE